MENKCHCGRDIHYACNLCNKVKPTKNEIKQHLLEIHQIDISR